MKQIEELVEIYENNENCVVVKFIGNTLDLIKFGCFRGNETYYTVTKSKDYRGDTLMILRRADGTVSSWYYGSSMSCIGMETEFVQKVLNGFINKRLGTRFKE